jgi:hypothetical protein
MHQQLWGYKVEEDIYLGVREREGLIITAVSNIQEVQRCGLQWNVVQTRFHKYWLSNVHIIDFCK